MAKALVMSLLLMTTSAFVLQATKHTSGASHHFFNMLQSPSPTHQEELMNADGIFSELRALLEKHPTQSLREELYAAINTFVEGATPESRAQFKTQYLPYVQEQLDASWPIELRWSCVMTHGIGELMCSKLLALTEWAAPKDLARALARIPRAQAQRFTGVWIHADKVPIKTVLAPLCARMKEVRHVEIESEDEMGALLDWLAAHHGETITHLTLRTGNEDLHAGYDDHVEGYIGELIPRLDGFPALRSLAINHTIAYYSKKHAYLPELMAHPVARQLESLDICANPGVFKDEWMTGSDVWKNLTRLRINGLPRARALALLEAPQLQHIKTWNLAGNGWGRQRDWTGPKTALWTAKAQHADPGESLRQAKVELMLIDDDDLRAMFLDEQGNLRPSSKLQELYSNWFTEDVFRALLTQGHIAYPNLKTITCRGVGEYVSPELYELINESALFAQTDTFEWYVLKIAPTFYRYLTREERLTRYEEWYMLAMRGHLHLSLRQRAWDTMLACADELTHYKDMAKAVGLKGRSKLKKDELKQRLEAMRPA
jgi:hypothetical protein